MNQDANPREGDIKSSTALSDKLSKVSKDLGPLVTVRTVAPIPASDVRRKFQENVEFHIDYSAGKYKGRPLINYLSNLDIKVRLHLTDPVETLDLVKAYLHHPGMAKIDDLIDMVMNLMLALVGKPTALSIDPTEFAMENREILSTWFRRIASLPLFAFYVNPDIDKSLIDSFPVDENASLEGINFVHLIAHPLFPLLIDGIPESAWNCNKTLFSERMYGGKNLFYFFAIPQNPLHMATISEGEDIPEVMQVELARSLEA